MNTKQLALITILIATPILTLAADASPSMVESTSIGESLWRKIITHQQTGQERSCSTCHTRDLTARGRHAKTGKPIEPMAPSVNPQRLSDERKIEKWFKRNCKWTYGRECTKAEKRHFLAYIRAQ